MAFYALGVKPLVDTLQEIIKEESCKQSWYADDSSASGKLTSIKLWWDKLNELGPLYGYFPKSTKTILLIKDVQTAAQARSLFSGSGVKVITTGHRYLGSVIGQVPFMKAFVENKISKWIEDVTELSTYAVEEPQLALSAYTKGLCHRWAFIQRTTPGISSLFSPLEECIREKFIPAVLGRSVSDLERRMISLPVRYGGLGISNPVEVCEREYHTS